MNHRDHVRLLQQGVPRGVGNWADFGSGDGAFTLALADLLGGGATIHSVDRDKAALRRQEEQIHSRFPDVQVHYHHADFTKAIDLPPLEGAVMANALHFHRSKQPVVELIRSYLKPGGRFILVEYDTDRGNPWVPHPISFHTWKLLAANAGLTETMLMDTVPSRFMGRIFSALSLSPIV